MPDYFPLYLIASVVLLAATVGRLLYVVKHPDQEAVR